VRQGQNVQIVLEGTNEAADRKQRAAQNAASAKAGAEAARKVRHSSSFSVTHIQFKFTESERVVGAYQPCHGGDGKKDVS
jgi:hypothetical protein